MLLCRNDPCEWNVFGCLCVLPTIHRWTWFEAKGGAEACAVIKAPALLDLPWAGGFVYILLAGGTADTGARGQRWCLVPNGLGWSGIVHPDPIPEAHFTADSESKKVKHLKAQYYLLFFFNHNNVHAFDLNGKLSSWEFREAAEGQPELVRKEFVSMRELTLKIWPLSFITIIHKQAKQGHKQTFTFCLSEGRTSDL